MAFRSPDSRNMSNMSASISIGVPDPLAKDKVDVPVRNTRSNRSSDRSKNVESKRSRFLRSKKQDQQADLENQTGYRSTGTLYDGIYIVRKPESIIEDPMRDFEVLPRGLELPPRDVIEDNTVGTEVVSQVPSIMRLHQRVLINIVLLIPLVLALIAFGMRQQDFRVQPERVSQVTVRGDILDRSGLVLAQGPAENRVYPHRVLAAPLIGFSGEEQAAGNHGLEGLEKTLDKHLQAGESVRTTIDLSLQSATQQALSETAHAYSAESGTAIVLQAGTGHILAAASYPEYDPNEQKLYDATAKNNRVFLQQIDPGSIFKPIVLAALLSSGKLDLNEQVPVAMSLEVGRNTFTDVMSHDEMLSVPDLLKYSSNVGMIEAAQRFKPDELYHWLRDFGFAKTVPLDEHYTGEGSMQHYDKWVPQDQAAISIGQGITVTALQLAVAYSVFANDGMLVAPRLALIDNPPKNRPLISKQLAENMRQMLVSAAEYGGARNSLVEGVRIAGKTGTADAFNHNTGTYERGLYTTSFAGMFPADNPEAVVVVMLHKPQGEKLYGSTVAAPVFQEIASAAMSLWEAPKR